MGMIFAVDGGHGFILFPRRRWRNEEWIEGIVSPRIVLSLPLS